MISDPGATDQEKIDNVLAGLPANFIFSGTYTLSTDSGDFTGNAFVVVGAPEPAMVALTGLATAALAGVCYPRIRRRWRRSRKPAPGPGGKQLPA